MLLQIQSEFERMGDYAINIQECAERLTVPAAASLLPLWKKSKP